MLRIKLSALSRFEMVQNGTGFSSWHCVKIDERGKGGGGASADMVSVGTTTKRHKQQQTNKQINEKKNINTDHPLQLSALASDKPNLCFGAVQVLGVGLKVKRAIGRAIPGEGAPRHGGE